MTTQDPAARVLDAARELGPEITARANQIEKDRAVPRELLDKLTQAGCFRLLLPPSVGGLGAELPGAMRVFEQLARADASVGWTVMLGSTTWIDIAGMPTKTIEGLYAGGPDVFIGGVISPMGARSTKADGGFRVNGRWTFASGCGHSQWLYGNTIENPETFAMRIVMFSRDQVEIEDTWHVSGLAGTGSHDFVAKDVFVPADRSYPLCDDEPNLKSPLLKIPPPVILSLEIASCGVGVAQGALDDAIAIAKKKVPLLDSGTLASNPLFQHRLGTAEVSLRAARSLLYAEADQAAELARSGGQFDAEQRARMRTAATHAATTAATVVDTVYNAAGGSSVYLKNPLQRRLRDVHALTQHFLIKQETFTAGGAVLAGEKAQLRFF